MMIYNNYNVVQNIYERLAVGVRAAHVSVFSILNACLYNQNEQENENA